MKIGRRPVFFLSLCVICLVLVPPTPAEFRWLNLVMAGLALFWAIAFTLEDLFNARGRESPRERR
jgi:hypothetical protein